MPDPKDQPMRIRARVIATAAVPALGILLLTAAPASAMRVLAAPNGIASAGVSQAAIDPATDTAFVGAGTDPADQVEAIDLATQTVTAVIPAGTDPLQVAVDPTSGTVYAANLLSGSVTVINAATDTATATISGLQGRPSGVVADPATGTAYVQLDEQTGPGEIAVINGTTGKLASVITLPASVPGHAGLGAITIDPVTGTLYALFDGSLASINTTTGTVASIITGLPPSGTLAADPATGTTYVAGGDNVLAINEATGQTTAQATLPAAAGAITVNPATGTLYVPQWTASGDYVALLNGTTLTQTGALPVTTPHNTAVDPVTDTLAIQTGGDLDVVTLTPPAITSQPSATLTAGTRASIDITGTGTPPPAYTETGRLPAGLTFTPDGELTGTPKRTTGGTHPIAITAANGISPAATQAFTLTVNQAPLITSPDTARFRTGTRHTFTIRASAYPSAAITEHDRLPRGLHFTAHRNGTATITGKALKADRGSTYRITITARNHIGKPATQSLTIHIT
jgi:large repetitive protein